MVIITAQLHLAKLKPRLCAGLNPACDVSEICQRSGNNAKAIHHSSSLSPSSSSSSSSSSILFLSFRGRGVPFKIQEGTNDLPRISDTDLLVASEAKKLYKQTYNRQLTDEPQPSLDLLSVHDTLIQ